MKRKQCFQKESGNAIFVIVPDARGFHAFYSLCIIVSSPTAWYHIFILMKERFCKRWYPHKPVNGVEIITKK